MNQPQKTKITVQSILTLLGITFISIVFVAGVYVLFFAPNAPLATTNEPVLLTEEERQALAAKVTYMYASETLPAAEEGKDPFNHGLDAEADSADTPLGTILFSGRKIRDVDKYTQIFALDLAGTSTTEPTPYIPEYFTSAMAEFIDPASPSDFFTLTASEYSIANEPDGVSVHHYDAETGTVQPFDEVTGLYERSISWSEESGNLAYGRFAANYETDIDLLSLDNWEVVVFNPETNSVVTIIQGALYPHWSPDGNKLVFLKTGGLYAYDLTAQTEQAVLTLPEGGISIATSMMDLSEDGTHLIWASAKSGMIAINEILSWDTLELNEIGRMQVPDTEFYWPVFSPDGKYYAVQAIDKLKGNDFVRKNARIEVRPLESRTVVYSHSVEDFIFDALFTDDWIAPKVAE